MRYFVTLSLSGLLLFMVSSLGLAQTDSVGTKTNEETGESISEEKKQITVPSCFQENFSGEYKTLKPNAFKFPSERYIFIHEGSCKCEGKLPTDCSEPVDDK